MKSQGSDALAMRMLSRSTRTTSLLAASAMVASVALTACLPNRNDDTAANLLPANTQGFLTAAVNPSLKQKATLLSLSTHLPSRVRAENADDVQNKLIDEVLKDSGLTYEADVKPWLGNEAALALLPPVKTNGTPVPVGVLKVTDEAKAKATFDKKSLDPASYRFVKGYALLVSEEDVKSNEGVKVLDAVSASAAQKSGHLGDSERFRSSLRSLKGEHLLLGWFDTPAIYRTTIAAARADDASLDTYFGELDKELAPAIDRMGAVAFELRATTDSVVFKVATENVAYEKVLAADLSLLHGLPVDTMAAFSSTGLGEGIEKAIADADKDASPSTPTGLDYADLLGLGAFDEGPALAAEKRLAAAIGSDVVIAVGNITDLDGFDFPVGAVAKTDDEAQVALAVDELVAVARTEGYTAEPITVDGAKGYRLAAPATPSYEDDSSYDFRGDPVAPAAPAFEEFEYDFMAFDEAPSTAGKTVESDDTLEPVVLVGNGRMVIAMNEAYARKLLAPQPQKLGDAPSFKAAFGDTGGAATQNQFFINAAAVVDLYKKAETESSRSSSTDKDAEAMNAWLDSLKSFSSQSWTDKEHSYFELRLTFK